MRTSLGDKVYAVLRRHSGAANHISAREICKALGWSPKTRERLVRQIIADESPLWCKQGALPVCAIGGRGYFMAETIEEVRNYRNWLRDLAEEARQKDEKFLETAAAAGLNLKELEEVMGDA